MTVECFLDTNVLVYAVSVSEVDAAKREKALELIENADFGLSAQVLQEFYVTVTRKIEKTLSPETALALLEELRTFQYVQTDFPLIVSAIEIAVRFGVSYWDGAIIAAAVSIGADTLYTEDLSAGQRYGSVRAVNPFMDLAASEEVHEAPSKPYGQN